jgi:hypothetical protein
MSERVVMPLSIVATLCTEWVLSRVLCTTSLLGDVETSVRLDRCRMLKWNVWGV